MCFNNREQILCSALCCYNQSIQFITFLFTTLFAVFSYLLLMFEKILNVAPIISVGNISFEMQNNSDDSVTVTSTQNDDVLRQLGVRRRRNVKKKAINLIHLFRNICSSQEKCVEWLKNKGLIPKVIFCPKCNNRMKIEPNNEVLDGYIWICKECAVDPPKFSSRHGSWLESRDYPLPCLLLYTYLWAHGFTLEQICKEANLPLSIVEEWNLNYCTICHLLYQRNIQGKDDLVDGNNLDIDKESSAEIWRKKNQSKDPFIQFLKDADSL